VWFRFNLSSLAMGIMPRKSVMLGDSYGGLVPV